MSVEALSSVCTSVRHIVYSSSCSPESKKTLMSHRTSFDMVNFGDVQNERKTCGCNQTSLIVKLEPRALKKK